MRPETANIVAAMARREAAAALLSPPLVETGAEGRPVRVRLVACPTCGAREHERRWAPPFDDRRTDGPVLSMLACETLTARAVLPIVVAAERFPELRAARFRTRGLAWLDVAHLGEDKALEAIDAAEHWVTDPAATDGRTLPASTRRHRRAAAWPSFRRELLPAFLSPHPAVSAEVERRYAAERRAAVLTGYGRRG